MVPCYCSGKYLSEQSTRADEKTKHHGLIAVLVDIGRYICDEILHVLVLQHGGVAQELQLIGTRADEEARRPQARAEAERLRLGDAACLLSAIAPYVKGQGWK